MRRRIIKQGHNTFTISLPRKWCIGHELKEGEEVDINEKGSALLISKESFKGAESVKADVTGLDRSTIILLIQSLYNYGYDTITITTKDSKAKYYWKNKEETIPSIINYAVSRLIGAEVISSSNNQYKVQVVTQESKEKFDLLLRRIFRLTIEMFDSYIERYKKQDESLIDSVVFTYLNIRKFINYALRLLNKYGHEEADKTTFYYSILTSLSRIAETVKNTVGSREIRTFKISKTCNALIEQISNSFKDYYDLFYKYDIKKVSQLHKDRDLFKRNLYLNQYKNLSKDDIFLLGSLTQVYEVMIDLIELKMAIGY